MPTGTANSTPGQAHWTVDFDRLLGLDLNTQRAEEITQQHYELLREREAARKRRDWKRADELRAELQPP
jgi:cysteinyl-tRNA synthetase